MFCQPTIAHALGRSIKQFMLVVNEKLLLINKILLFFNIDFRIGDARLSQRPKKEAEYLWNDAVKFMLYYKHG